MTLNSKNVIMGIFISSGNRKMGYIPSFSTLPGPESVGGSCDQENSKYCYKFCYAKNHCMRAKPTYKQNQDIAVKSPETVFDSIVNYLTRFAAPKHFRWFVSGDFVSQKFLYTVLRICSAVPDVLHLAFSKRFSFVSKCVAKIKKTLNLSLILSGCRDMPIPKRLLNNFVFSWIDDGGDEYWKEKRPAGYRFRECPGKCDDCGICWRLRKADNTDIIFHKH